VRTTKNVSAETPGVAYHRVGIFVHDQHAQVLLTEEADIGEDGTQLDDLSPLREFGL
jgi:hypothetical protein